MSLARFVPDLIKRRIAADPRPNTEPVGEPFQAAVLFADISGFTPLTERLEEQEALSERSQPCHAWRNVLSGLFGLSGAETRDQVRELVLARLDKAQRQPGAHPRGRALDGLALLGLAGAPRRRSQRSCARARPSAGCRCRCGRAAARAPDWGKPAPGGCRCAPARPSNTWAVPSVLLWVTV